MADACSNDMISDTEVGEQVELHSNTEETSKPLTPNDADPPDILSKRPAEDSLQNDIRKAAKLSHDDGVPATSGPARGSKETLDIETQIAGLGRQLKRTNDELDACIAAKTKLQQRHDELLCQLAENDIIPGKQQVHSKNEETRARALATAMLQKERQKIKTDYSKKLDAEKTTIQTQYCKKLDVLKKALEQKGKALKEECNDKIKDLELKHEIKMKTKEKELNSIKGKAEREVTEFKASKAEHAEEVKNLKAEHKNIQKELKAKHTEDIKAWKPEHSKAVKEKDAALKEKDKELADLGEALKKLTEEKAILENKLSAAEVVSDHYKKALESKQEEVHIVQHHLNNRNDDVRRVLNEKEALELALDKEKETLKAASEAKTKHQGKQWQVQHDKAEYMAQGVMQQQRANFVLRHSLDRKIEKIEEMQTELGALKEQIRSLQESTSPAEKRTAHGRSRVDSNWDF